MLEYFARPGGASFIVGGQWGSEAKGAAAAHLAPKASCHKFTIATTNAGAQAGHTSVHDGVKRVVFHLPTYSLYRKCFTYLNAGSIIDPDVLLRELDENPSVLANGFAIHPNAAIITQDCKDAEGSADSAQTKIASTRKGVGEALARKVLRSGAIAQDQAGVGRWAYIARYVKRLDLNEQMRTGQSVLVEVPQGHSLSIDSQFYPHTTSRNCTVAQAMSDAGIHPRFYHQSMLVIRTYPIRVGSLSEDNHSGGHFPDQQEITWDELGVEPEITTVTKRVRRVFTFSEQQVALAITQTQPDVIFLSFCDYLPPLLHPPLLGGAVGDIAGSYKMAQRHYAREVIQRLRELTGKHGQRGCSRRVEILTSWGPTTDDVMEGDQV